MASKRKLWATGFYLIGTPMRRHESKASAYRQVENDVRNWLAGALRSQHLTVSIDERDGQGWQVYERIDLAELAACTGSWSCRDEGSSRSRRGPSGTSGLWCDSCVALDALERAGWTDAD